MARTKGPNLKPPTEEQRKRVELCVLAGCTQDMIAKIMQISERSLQTHYQEILTTALSKANSNVAGSLYRNAIRGNVAAQIFWMKVRCGWREKVDHEVTGPGGKDIIVNVNIREKVKP